MTLDASGAASSLGILRSIAREVHHRSGADSVALYEFDANANCLIPVVGYRVPRSLVESHGRAVLHLERWSILTRALRNREPVDSRDPGWESGVDTVYVAALPSHSAALVPMVVNGESVGVMWLLWWAPPTMTPSLSPAIAMLGTSAGATLQAMRLGSEASRRPQIKDVLDEVTRAAVSTPDFYSAMRHLLRGIARTTGADIVGAYVLENNGEWLTPVQGYHLPPDRLGALRTLKLSIKKTAFYAEGFASRRAILTANVMDEPRIDDHIRFTVPHRAQLFVPISAHDRVVGGIVALWITYAPQAFQPSDVRTIESLAAQAGIVIENARLFEAYERCFRELPPLRRVASSVLRELQRNAILSALEAPVGPGFGVDGMELYWQRPRSPQMRLLLRLIDGVPDRAVPRLVSMDATGLVGVVARSGKPVRTGDMSAECRSRSVTPPSSGDPHRYWLGVPALADGQPLGVLAVSHRHFPFTATHERALSRTAQLVALALGSAAAEVVLTQGPGAQIDLPPDLGDVLSALLTRAQRLREESSDSRLSECLRVIEQSMLSPSAHARVEVPTYSPGI